MDQKKDISLRGRMVDIPGRRIYPAELTIRGGRIAAVRALPEEFPQADPKSGEGYYILPGFIDAHVHIESSMLTPAEFGRLAVVHGTVASVSDPHEIANVCGVDGVNYMIGNARQSPFKCFFGAPSCVPATPFETAGAALDAEAVESLLERKEIHYLSEMMNFPGVLNRDAEPLRKIEAAKKNGKPVDGHAPGLRGALARQYIQAGISTDHECVSREEALDKLESGMKIIIREGSAAKNFEALAGLLQDFPDRMMFCSDDKHPDSLVAGHINQLCARAARKGIDIFHILQAACVNPVRHYGLDVGLLRPGDPADLILVQDLEQFGVYRTYIEGELVAENGRSFISPRGPGKAAAGQGKEAINRFNCREKLTDDFAFRTQREGGRTLAVIEALDGQLITNKRMEKIVARQGSWQCSPEEDILKLVVVNRYQEAPVAKAFIRSFGLREGAIASSVAHDSHNIIAVGTDDPSLCQAVNLIIRAKGGISCAAGEQEMLLALPVAGLMSPDDGYRVAAAYTALDAMAKRLGSRLSSPFMTLSFMALLVIPHIKLSDLGLFDGDAFAFLEPEEGAPEKTA